VSQLHRRGEATGPAGVWGVAPRGTRALDIEATRFASGHLTRHVFFALYVVTDYSCATREATPASIQDTKFSTCSMHTSARPVLRPVPLRTRDSARPADPRPRGGLKPGGRPRVRTRFSFAASFQRQRGWRKEGK
jgi:hypothetical protein